MKVTILYNGEYPGFSPGYNRVRYYVKGLEESGAGVSVLPVFLKSGSFVSQLWNSFIVPFIILRKHRNIIRHSDHLLIYEFNWWTYLILRIFRPRSLRMHLEVNEKPEAVYSSRFFELPPVKKLNMALTRFSFRFFDGFVAISGPLRDYIMALKGKKAKIVVLPILTDPFVKMEASEYPIPDHPYTLHSGALSQIKDGMINTFQAFAAANKALGGNLHFYLTSKVAPKEVQTRIDQIISEEQIQGNVHFIGLLAEADLRRLQANCSFVVINKPDNDQNRYNFPTKLGEYLSLAKPVITTRVGDLVHYLVHNESALLLDAGDDKALADSMVSLVRDAELANRIGMGGRRVSEELFHYGMNGKRLMDYLNSFR